MSESLSPRQSLGSLSIGNVVSAAVVLYRSHLKLYLGIALRAILWSMLPFFASLVLFFITDTGLKFLIFLGLGIFCLPKYLSNAALISRLAYCELINELEPVSQARSFVISRQWSFFRICIQVIFYIICIYLLLAIIVGIMVGVGAGIGGAITAFVNNQILGYVITAIFGIVGFVTFLFVLFWFISRWLIAEVPLAVEREMNGGLSISRAWELTQNFVIRVELIVLVAALVSLPIIGITSYLPQFILSRLQPGSELYTLVSLVSFLTGSFGNLVILPFWQSIKAVIYYDLRTRKEGIDLQIRET